MRKIGEFKLNHKTVKVYKEKKEGQYRYVADPEGWSATIPFTIKLSDMDYEEFVEHFKENINV